jgi:hypothetical protein
MNAPSIRLATVLLAVLSSPFALPAQSFPVACPQDSPLTSQGLLVPFGFNTNAASAARSA